MFRQQYYQDKFLAVKERNEARLRNIINMPIVYNKEDAKTILKGLKKMAEMPGGELTKLRKLSAKEIKENYPDDDVRMSVAYMDKALGFVQSAMTGTLQFNSDFMKHMLAVEMSPKLKQARAEKEILETFGVEKSYHSYVSMNPAATQILDMNIQLGDTSAIDLSWAQAFVGVDATNAAKIKRMNWASVLSFKEYKASNSPIQSQSLSGPNDEEFGPRFFAASVEWADDDFRFSVFNVNQLLTMLREAAANMTSMHAYREIFDATGVMKYAASDKYTGGTDDKEKRQNRIYRARTTLNDTHFKMINRARGLQVGKKKEAMNEKPINVNAGTPIMFFVNHAHYDLLEGIRNATSGEDGVNQPFLKPWVFVETALGAVSGGYTIKSGSLGERDEFGFYGTMQEIASNKEPGGMAVIPGFLNTFANFRSLSFLQERKVIEEGTMIAAKMAERFLFESRQKAHVSLGTIS